MRKGNYVRLTEVNSSMGIRTLNEILNEVLAELMKQREEVKKLKETQNGTENASNE